MFIQSAPPGHPNRAIMMRDHTILSEQFARAFGNGQFEAPVPHEPVVYAIANHDAGWVDFDRDPATDPETRLPYSVFGTPAQHILPTSKGSPDYNQRHHSYSGLLSSMHTWGIYNARYGFTNAGRLRRIADADKPAVDAMLSYELERQKALKAELARSPETAAWLEEGRLFQNYKLLQFCDLMAIYFNYNHPDLRTEQDFTNVPTSRERDATVTLRPKGDGVYELSPFPFIAPGGMFAFASRPITPGQHETDGGWAAILRRTPIEWETFRLVAG